MSVVTIIPSLEIDFQTFILCGDFPLVRWPEGVVFCSRWDHRPVTDSPWCCALSYCRSMVCIDSPTKAVKGALSPSQRSQGGKFFPGILSAPWPPIKSGNAQKKQPGSDDDVTLRVKAFLSAIEFTDKEISIQRYQPKGPCPGSSFWTQPTPWRCTSATDRISAKPETRLATEENQAPPLPVGNTIGIPSSGSGKDPSRIPSQSQGILSIWQSWGT